MSKVPRIADLFNDLPLDSEEDSEEESTVVPPPGPVSPAPPPSAGPGGEDLPTIDSLFEDGGIRGASNYGGETWKELGIKLPDNLLEELGGENSVIPQAEVEKGAEIPTPWNEGKWGHSGKMAFDMVALRDKVADARSGAWTRQFAADNKRAPTQEEEKEKYIELAAEANDEIYALAERTRGGRASALPGSQGVDRRFLWLDSDPGGKLYDGGLGISTAKQEDRGFISKIFSPFIVNMAGAEHNLLVEELDEDGRVKEKFIEAPYNESHFLGWLDWLGRESILTYASTAAVAGQSEEQDSWSAGATPWALVNPVNYYNGWGSDKQLQLLSRGEDIVSLREELNLRRMGGASYLLDGAEAVGLISPDTNKTAQNLTEFATAFGLAIIDPDVFSLMTLGVGKVAKGKLLLKVGDILGTSTKAKAVRRLSQAEEVGEQLANLAMSSDIDTFEIGNQLPDILKIADSEQTEIAIQIARVIVASDPKASKATEALAARVLDYKKLERGYVHGQVKASAVVGRGGSEEGGKALGKVQTGETEVLKAAQEALAVEAARKTKKGAPSKVGQRRAKKIQATIEEYKAAQLADMWAASTLADLKTQKLVTSRLQRLSSASKGTASLGSDAIQKGLAESAKRAADARIKMQEAFMETPKPRGDGSWDTSNHTAKYAAAQKEHNAAVSHFAHMSMEASLSMGSDAEKFLDTMIANAMNARKGTSKKLKDVTKLINKGNLFSVDPSEHIALVKGLIKNAPSVLEERALVSALALAFKEQASGYKKLIKFINENPQVQSVFMPATGGASKQAQAYREAAGVDLGTILRADEAGIHLPYVEPILASAALPRESLADFTYTGFKGIEDRAGLRDKLAELRTTKKVAEWVSGNAESPVYREIAKKVAKALPDDPEARVVVVDNAWLRKKEDAEEGFISYAEIGRASKEVIDGKALGTSSYRWDSGSVLSDSDPTLGHGVLAPTISLKGNDELMSGLTAETILHELIHAATQEKIFGVVNNLDDSFLGEVEHLKDIAKEINPKIDSAIREMVHRAIHKAELGNRTEKGFTAQTGWAHESLELLNKLEKSGVLRPQVVSSQSEELRRVVHVVKQYVVGKTWRPRRTPKQRELGYPRAPREIADAGGIWWDAGEAWNKLIVDKTETIKDALKRRHMFEHALGNTGNGGLYGARQTLQKMLDEGGLDESLEPALTALHKVLSGKIENLQETVQAFDDASHLKHIADIIAGFSGARLGGGDGVNVHELISYGLTDPVFNSFLKNTKSSDKLANDSRWVPTLWTSFVSTIAKLLEIDPKDNTILAKLLSTTERLLPPAQRKRATDRNGFPLLGLDEILAQPLSKVVVGAGESVSKMAAPAASPRSWQWRLGTDFDITYTGFKGVRDRSELRDKLEELGSIYKVAEWTAHNAEDPILKNIAQKLAKVLPKDPQAKVIMGHPGSEATDASHIGYSELNGALGHSKWRQRSRRPHDMGSRPTLGYSSEVVLSALDPHTTRGIHGPGVSAFKGLNAETIVHEILHVATQEQVSLASRLAYSLDEANLEDSSELIQAYKSLEEIANIVYPTSKVAAKKWVVDAAKRMEEVVFSPELAGAVFTTRKKGERFLWSLSDNFIRSGKVPTELVGSAAHVKVDDLYKFRERIAFTLEHLKAELRMPGGSVYVVKNKHIDPDRAAKGLSYRISELNKNIAGLEDIINPKIFSDGTKWGGIEDIQKFLKEVGEPDITKEVLDFHNTIKKAVKELNVAGETLENTKELTYRMSLIGGPGATFTGKSGKDLHELITYGLTNKVVRDFMKTVVMPGPSNSKETIWSSLVSSIMKLLGVSPTGPNRSAISELMSATEQIMDIPLPEALEQVGYWIGKEWKAGRLKGLSAKEDISKMAADVPTTDAGRRANDMYMIEQVELLTGWSSKGNQKGALGRSVHWLGKTLMDFWDPAQRALGPASQEVHQIGIAMFGLVKKMQEDIVKAVNPTAEQAGKDAVKAAQEAGKFDNLSGDNLSKAQAIVRQKAQTKVVISYFTDPSSVQGSLVNTLFGEGRSLWDMAKPMLRASAGKEADAEMAFNALSKMWLPPGASVNKQIIGMLNEKAQNLLTYGVATPGKLKGKSAEEMAKLKQAGNNISFEDFSKAMRDATKNLPWPRGGGAGGSDPNTVRVNLFAAQAVSQMALMNHASTRINKVLADFDPESIEAAVRLAAGDSLNPGQDMVEAMQVLNKLKVPGKLRIAGDKATFALETGLKLYSDGDGFRAIVPASWMQKTSELLSNIEKTAESMTVVDPWEQASISAYRGVYRLWHTAILTGLFIPRAAYFTNIYVGNLSQIVARQGLAAGWRYTKEAAKDIFVLAPMTMAHKTPLGKYVDATMDAMAAKFPGEEFALASPTNAMINGHISEIMNPGLADNAMKIVGKGGKEYTMGGLRLSAAEQGIFTSFVQGSGLANLMSRTNPGFGKKMWEQLQQGGPMAVKYADFANTLEQRQRVGLFTDLVVNKGMTPEEAGKITRDALYDWDGPMTKAEMFFAKNMFMFYNFTRRAMGQAMRILLDPYLSAVDDTLKEGVLRSSPALAMLTGKPAYQSANLMAMDKARRETHEYLSDEDTAAEYPWWAKKSGNKMFLPNTPMGEARSDSYSQTLGRDVDYKVMTMPSFTPIEMANQWGDLVSILGAYGVAWAVDTPAHIITGARPSQVNFKDDVIGPLFEKLAEQAGPLGEDAIKGIAAGWGEGKQSYLKGGANVTRLSDRKVLEWLNASMGPFMGGFSWEDAKNPGMVRTDTTTLAVLRGIPGIANEINTLFGPALDVSAEGGEVSEMLKETLLSYLNFKTYRYSPEQVRDWDKKEIKSKMGVKISEANRKMPIGTGASKSSVQEPAAKEGVPTIADLFK